MKNKGLFAAVFVVVGACNNMSKVNQNRQHAVLPATGVDTASVVDSSFLIDSSAAILPKDQVISEIIPAENIPVMNLQKTITAENQSVHLQITGLDIGQIRISLRHSNPDANIRISKIVMPDGSTDGPFGRELSYNLPQKGNYTIVIGKSNMASGSPVGVITVAIEK